MAESFSKKEKEKKRQQKKKEKEQRKADRKANAKSGQSLEEMMAYVDENGNISSSPPDAPKKVIKESDIVIGSRNTGDHVPASVRKGKVTYFNTQKGYGFIKDIQTQESVFVHQNSLSIIIKENDLVTFEKESGPKGLTAVNVKKI